MSETDRFLFNSSFTSPLAKIKIQQIANKVETAEENKETKTKVEEERKNLASVRVVRLPVCIMQELMISKAAIVRTMKDRKAMLHTDLVHEVTRQLSTRFLPKTVMIKQQIELMLEREYLERDVDNRKQLRYLA